MRAKIFYLIVITVLQSLIFGGCGSENGPTTPQVGNIIINPNPDSIEAPWLITGPGGFNYTGSGDYILGNMFAGYDYTLTWGSVSGWTTPDPVATTQHLSGAALITFTGTYVVEAGTITINAEPNILNASWHITGPNGFDHSGSGDSSFTDMLVGDYTLTWGAVSGWSTPSPAITTLSLTDNNDLVFTGVYIELFHGLSFGSTSSLDIITWNLHNFPSTTRSVEYAVRALRAIDADIVALQEIVSSNRFNALNDSLVGYSGFRATGAPADQNLALLWKDATVTPIRVPYEIYTDEYAAFPRSPLVLECTALGSPLLIVVNHFKAYDDNNIDWGNPEDDEYRRYLACQFLDIWIRNEHPNESVIVLGDLNDKLTDPPSYNVFQLLLDAPELYMFADMPLATGPSSGWSYRYSNHLDHILITNELFELYNQASTTIITLRMDSYLNGGWNEYETNVSDHLPVGLSINMTSGQ